MNNSHPLYDLYKEFYFHEIDMREKLNGRLQIPLLLIITLSGAIVYLLQTYEMKPSDITYKFYSISLGVGCVSLIICAYYFVRSYFDYTYKFLPSSQETEEYLNTLNETYDEYDDGKELAERYLENYLCSYFIDCASKNTECNDRRSLFLHKTNKWLIIVAACTLLSFVTAFLGDFNKRKESVPLQVKIVNMSSLEGGLNGEGKKAKQKEQTAPAAPAAPAAPDS
ncbi:MAG: hypothetical protein KKE29_14065 [Proteobacteria bacterium]|nr:hypothetical protein [Pseudomonadota bacterium]MBU4577072.1 hypothetical protein [Pseudomonadota bacterium]MBU4598772.1 hypothetical protein [Pseudomonadota bacterium]MBV1715088.1 hypothetical protein [Desulfarculus sp.]MBV1751520.1 hypothetical protein [Desulfarculus sp.]